MSCRGSLLREGASVQGLMGDDATKALRVCISLFSIAVI